MSAEREPLLAIRGLEVRFAGPHGEVRAVDGMSLEVGAGESVGLVGESGAGKSQTALAVLGLIEPPGRIAAGSIRFEGRELVGLSATELRRVRGRGIALVFQDSSAALDPVLTLGDQIGEGLRAHLELSRAEAHARAVELLAQFGVEPAAARAGHYPHQLSGGMRQRAALAIALALAPRLLIADEPTTALDPTLEAQVLELVRRYAAREGAGVLWIAHDLELVREACERMAVMFAGRIVEAGPTRQLFERPRHPYTRALVRALALEPEVGPRVVLPAGSIGCRYRPRCPMAVARCTAEEPALSGVAPARLAACFRHAEVPVP